MALGKMGARGGFGSQGDLGKPAGGGSPPAFAPSLDFSDSRNSQYQPLVISMSDDPYEHIDPGLIGPRYRKNGQMP